MNEVTKIIEIDSFELILYSVIDRKKDVFTVVRLHPDEISNEMIFSTVQNQENMKKKYKYALSKKLREKFERYKALVAKDELSDDECKCT